MFFVFCLCCLLLVSAIDMCCYAIIVCRWCLSNVFCYCCQLMLLSVAFVVVVCHRCNWAICSSTNQIRARGRVFLPTQDRPVWVSVWKEIKIDTPVKGEEFSSSRYFTVAPCGRCVLLYKCSTSGESTTRLCGRCVFVCVSYRHGGSAVYMCVGGYARVCT